MRALVAHRLVTAQCAPEDEGRESRGTIGERSRDGIVST